ncbi:hypothetical protein C7B90_11060, partial [Lysinibacillus fusiformis]
MKPIVKSEIVAFEKNYKKSKKGREIEFLKAGYKLDPEKFHKLFLHSGISMGLDQTKLKELLSELHSKKYLDTVKDLEFIIYLKEKMDIHDNTIRNIFLECQKKIEVEDLFNYLEYIKYK